MKTAKELPLKTGIEFSNVDFMNCWPELRADYEYLLSKTGNLICPSAEGGCSCDKCWPWAGKSYYDMTRRLTRFAKERYPHLEFWLFTWYVGHGDDHK